MNTQPSDLESAHLPENWLDTLPFVLRGLRSSFKPDLATSSAELVYGTTLKSPGEFFPNTPATSTSSFLQMLRHHARSFRPVSTTHRDSSAVFVSGELIKASHLFLRIDRVRKSLEPPYAGQGPVKNREGFYCGDQRVIWSLYGTSRDGKCPQAIILSTTTINCVMICPIPGVFRSLDGPSRDGNAL
ncbi:hypothetical protein AVEN_47974-1 [Araneus ventricosus]|uniref:Uncharacterized protein n=1 Tax=Araneus ventricosus TaxID=182803 RepID=A0A4Y2JQJ7_ARAVE|nr:hypothetical protein AVEN_47974-1 [Araneus ventricosus]